MVSVDVGELQLDRPSNGAWRAFDGATARDFAGYECADKANISNLPGFTGKQLPLLLPKRGQHVALDPHTDELTKAVRAHGAEVPDPVWISFGAPFFTHTRRLQVVFVASKANTTRESSKLNLNWCLFKNTLLRKCSGGYSHLSMVFSNTCDGEPE